MIFWNLSIRLLRRKRKFSLLKNLREKQRHRATPIVFGSKKVVVVGTHNGKEITRTRYGSGRELLNFVIGEMTSDYWDSKPQVKSE